MSDDAYHGRNAYFFSAKVETHTVDAPLGQSRRAEGMGIPYYGMTPKTRWKCHQYDGCLICLHPDLRTNQRFTIDSLVDQIPHDADQYQARILDVATTCQVVQIAYENTQFAQHIRDLAPHIASVVEQLCSPARRLDPKKYTGLFSLHLNSVWTDDHQLKMIARQLTAPTNPLKLMDLKIVLGDVTSECIVWFLDTLTLHSTRVEQLDILNQREPPSLIAIIAFLQYAYWNPYMFRRYPQNCDNRQVWDQVYVPHVNTLTGKNVFSTELSNFTEHNCNRLVYARSLWDVMAWAWVNCYVYSPKGAPCPNNSYLNSWRDTDAAAHFQESLMTWHQLSLQAEVFRCLSISTVGGVMHSLRFLSLRHHSARIKQRREYLESISLGHASLKTVVDELKTDTLKFTSYACKPLPANPDKPCHFANPLLTEELALLIAKWVTTDTRLACVRKVMTTASPNFLNPKMATTHVDGYSKVYNPLKYSQSACVHIECMNYVKTCIEITNHIRESIRDKRESALMWHNVSSDLDTSSIEPCYQSEDCSCYICRRVMMDARRALFESFDAVRAQPDGWMTNKYKDDPAVQTALRCIHTHQDSCHMARTSFDRLFNEWQILMQGDEGENIQDEDSDM